MKRSSRFAPGCDGYPAHRRRGQRPLTQLSITHLNKWYVPHVGGVERALHWIARACVRRGDLVRAIVCAPGPVPRRWYVDGVDIRGVPSFGVLQSVPIAPSYPFALPRRSGSIWHLHEPFPLGTVGLLLRAIASSERPLPAVVTWHSDVVRQRLARPMHTALVRALLDRVAIIHVATQAHVENSAVLPAYRAKVRVVPFIVDVDRFRRVPDHAVARRIREWADGDPVALFAGRFVYYKGLDVLLAALARVPRLRLVLAGDGPLRAMLEARARQLGLVPRLLWLRTPDDDGLVGAYSGCDFFVLPSTGRAEAFGLVQVEAMAAGLPVISTRLATGAATVNIDGATGILVTPGDDVVLAEALCNLTEAPDMRARFAVNAVERAADFAEGRLAERYRDLYREAAAAA